LKSQTKLISQTSAPSSGGSCGRAPAAESRAANQLPEKLLALSLPLPENKSLPPGATEMAVAPAAFREKSEREGSNNLRRKAGETLTKVSGRETLSEFMLTRYTGRKRGSKHFHTENLNQENHFEKKNIYI